MSVESSSCGLIGTGSCGGVLVAHKRLACQGEGLMRYNYWVMGAVLVCVVCVLQLCIGVGGSAFTSHSCSCSSWISPLAGHVLL